MGITFDDLPNAAPAISFDDLPEASHGIRFDDLPDAVATQGPPAPTLDEVRASKGLVTPKSEEQLKRERVGAAFRNELQGTMFGMGPADVAALDATGPLRAGIEATPTGVTQGGVDLKGIANAVIAPLKEYNALLQEDKNGIPAAPTLDRIQEEQRTPLVTLPKPAGDTITAGIGRGVGTVVESLTTPENVALMAALPGAPAALQKVISGGFAAQMATHAPEQVQAVGEAQTPAAKAQAVTELLASLAMIGAAGAHAAGRAPVSADIRAAGMDAAHGKVEAAEFLKGVPIETLQAAASDPRFRETSPYDPALIDAEIIARPARELAAANSPLTAAETLRQGVQNETQSSSPTNLNARLPEDPAAQLSQGGETIAMPARAEDGANGANETGRQPVPVEASREGASPEATPDRSTAPPTEPAQGRAEAAPKVEGALGEGRAESAPEATLGVEGAKLGPGAANIEEPLARYEERRFGQRFTRDESIDPTLREQTGNRYYEPLPNRLTAEEAVKVINDRGIDEATRLIRDEKSDVSPAVRSTVGQVIIKQLNESYRSLKETNPVEANKVLDKAVDLAEWQMEYGTRLGQGVQSFAMWSRLSPEGKLRTYVKAVDKARARVEKETNGEVSKVEKAAREIAASQSKPREDAIEREANRIARQLSDTPEFGKKKAPNDAVDLIRKHLRNEVPEFQDRLTKLGAKPETAAQIDRMATENRKRIAAIDREKRIEALRKRLTKEKNSTAKKLKPSTIEKIMGMADDGLLKDKGVWDAVSKDLGLPDYSPETAREIQRLGADVDAAAEGIPRNEAMQRLTNFIASQKGFAAGDLPMSIWYANVLSGYNTHIVNALDTGLNVMSELGNMAISNPKQIPAMVRGVIRGLGEGKADAILALSEGRKVTDGKYAEVPGLLEASKFGTKGGVPIQPKTVVGKALKGAAESKLAYPLNAYKYVGRLMTASDTVFFRAAEEARAGVLAYREAMAKGVEKSQLRAEADKLLGYDRIGEFEAQAKAEGYTGAKAEARATELMMQSRPEALREGASEFAGLATYNHAPEGLLGSLANRVSQLTNDVPPLKLIVPFTRIVANVTNRGLDWTPYGFKRALAGRTFGDGPMFGEARSAALTKAAAGTMALSAVGLLNQTGVIQLHGNGPSDPEKRKQLLAAGWKPYSIQIGDTYVSYAPTPLGLGLSTLANYLDADRYQELKQKDALTRSAYSLSRIGSTIFSQSFLSSISGLMDALSASSPGKQISAIKQLVSRTASGFVTPNILKDVNKIFDPVSRDSNSIAEDLIRDIPVARLALNPALNAFGEPIAPPSNRFVSVKKSDPAWRLVADKNLRIPVADDTVFTEPKAGYEYQKQAGEGMKKFINASLPRLQSMTDDDAQEYITRAASGIFENARSRVRSKYPNSLRKRK